LLALLQDSKCWHLAQNPNVAHIMAMLWRDALQVTEPEDSKAMAGADVRKTKQLVKIR
jgi:hypothetical protein